MWQQLGIDVELADPAGDELGELAAEVEDDDRSGGRRGGIWAGAIRGRGVQCGLEVGLDLRIVRCEDAVPGIGRLTVDGLAALSLPAFRRGGRG
jgi:hypothetical protein